MSAFSPLSDYRLLHWQQSVGMLGVGKLWRQEVNLASSCKSPGKTGLTWKAETPEMKRKESKQNMSQRETGGLETKCIKEAREGGVRS